MLILLILNLSLAGFRTVLSCWLTRYLRILAALWDSETHEKLDKDRFRRDLGNVEDAYEEMMKRIFGK